MSESLRPLLDRDEDLRVSDVLRSGLDDEPSAESFARAARALGLGSAVALTAAATATAGASKAAGGASGAASLLTLIAKWFAVGALMGGVVATPLALGSAPSIEGTTATESRPRQAARVPPAAVPIRAGNAAPDPRPEAEAKPPAQPMREANTAPAGSAPTSTSGSSVASFPSPPQSGLDREVALLDGVRRALRSGDPSSALGSLDGYDRSPAPHALDSEAQLLRVQALVASGRGAEAERIARAVLARRGNDGYACRLAKIAKVASSGCPDAN